MEAKKTPEADLENKRTLFFLMGFAVALSTFYVLMEWKSGYSESNYYTELIAPVFIEKGYGANTQIDIEERQTVLEPKVEMQEQTVYEEYQVVENVSPEEQEKQDLAQDEQIHNLELENEKDEEVVVQTLKTYTQTDDVVTEAEEMPQFPGGNVELIRFIYNNIQYPSAALKQRIQGRVWSSFIVNEDGTITDVMLEEGVYIFLDEEAIRVLKMMPPWIPGKNQGKNARIKVYMPIVFKI